MHSHTTAAARVATISALLAGVLCSPGVAQYTVGVKGGLTAANFTGNDVQGTRWQAGFATGVFLTYHFVENLSLQPELIYIQKGANHVLTGPDQNQTARVLLDYVEIPVSVRMTLPLLARRASLYLMAGPSIAFRASCEVRTENSAASNTEECNDAALHLRIRSIDGNMTGGAGFGLHLTDATFFMETRYHIGLATIDRSSPPDDIYHQVFAFMAGVSIPLGRRPIVSASR